MKKIHILIIIAFLISTTCWAQESSGASSISSSSAFSFSGTMGDENQLRMQTYIWGQINKPGLYIVPDDTDLIALISFAKGPTEDAKISKIRIVRSGFGTQKNEIIEVNLEKFLETGNRELIPILMEGDTVIVPATVFYGMERVATFISKFATVLSMYSIYLSIANN
ncbi:MAG: hypothetical protein U9P79_01900 [Candidatus Cloacimonadota bacterium]|nr:hypothetical protein [Candidatus Cloacimonadota bacterium]